jgi:hypothetical protein
MGGHRLPQRRPSHPGDRLPLPRGRFVCQQYRRRIIRRQANICDEYMMRPSAALTPFPSPAQRERGEGFLGSPSGVVIIAGRRTRA